MSGSDLYAVLGVPRNATVDEIRRAYRTKARQLHPDVNKAPDAQKRFADLQYASEVLTDPQKRGLYDQFGHEGLQSGFVPPGARAGSAGQATWSSPYAGEDLDEVFATFFGGRASGQQRAGKAGRAGRAKARRVPEPITIETAISFLTACRGGVEHVRITVADKAKTLEVTIPPGVVDGAQLRIRAIDGPGSSDLILILQVGAHPLFRRAQYPGGDIEPDSLDLYLDLPLTYAEAAIGATVMVPSLKTPIDVKIPPGTGSGKLLRLRGKGIVTPNRTGDMYVVIQIVPPADMTDSEKRALESVSRHNAPRRGNDWPS